MENKYLEYSLEELIEDKCFVAWVLHGRKNGEWEKFVSQHPSFATKSKKGHEIVNLLQDKYEDLNDNEVWAIWHNISNFNRTNKKKGRSINLSYMLKWAVSVALIISLGTLGYYFINEKSNSYTFSTNLSSNTQNESRLLLSDGEEINLEKDKSTIEINDKNEIVINHNNTLDLSGKESAAENEKMNEVVVPFGKRSELLLADGTRVWLNAGSRLAFPTKFTKNTREVYLEGEACFKVAKNEAMPFIVNTEKLDVEVLGTHFNVSAYPDDEIIQTVLVEGSVAINKNTTFGIGKQKVILKPFQKASFNKNENEIVVEDEPQADVYLAWTEGWFQFSKQDLKTVFRKIERYYSVEMVVPENFPSTEVITGKLDLKDSIEEVMMVLKDVANIDYQIRNEIIYVDKELKVLKMRN